MSKVEAVIFDADGTLFDTFELIVSAYEHVAVTHGLRIPTPDEVRDQLGKALPDIFQHFYPNEDIQTLLDTNNAFVAANTMKSAAFAGVKDLLSGLARQGIQLGILTSGSAKVHDVLRHHQLDQFFTSVVHHERIKKPKPDPEGYWLACVECGVPPENGVMVGDTTFDIETGQNAGALTTIAVTHGFGLPEDLAKAQPGYIAHDIFEVDKIITTLL